MDGGAISVPAMMAIGGAVAGGAMDKQNPLRGAALGAFGGYTGGAALGAMGAGAGASAGAAGAAGAGAGAGALGSSALGAGATEAGIGLGAGAAEAGMGGMAASQAAQPAIMSAFSPAPNLLGSGLAGADTATLIGANAPLGSMPMGMQGAALNPMSQAAANAGMYAAPSSAGLSSNALQMARFGSNMMNMGGQQKQQQRPVFASAPPPMLNPNSGGSFAQASPYGMMGGRRVGIL